MEVFMRNLPPHLTDRTLDRLLQPFMNQLSVTVYMAEKQRNKSIGHITFLHEADGEKFLQHHGEEEVPPTFQPRRQHKHPPSKARLSLMGNPVFCKLSNRPPHALALKAVEHEARQHPHDEASADPTKTLEAAELNCGYHTLENGRLTFTSEWAANEACLVRFAKRSLFVTLRRRNVELRIPFQSIVELVWWQDGHAAVTLLWPPAIFASQSPDNHLVSSFSVFGIGQTGNQTQASQRQRLEAVDRDHARISACCLVYHFTVPNAITRHVRGDFESEMVRMRDRQLFSVTRHDFGFQQAHGVIFSKAAANLRDQLAGYNRSGSLPFGLLFLLQALVTNSYLHPDTVAALGQKLVHRFAQAKEARIEQPPISVDAFKGLFDWIDYPTPHGDQAMFEVDGIMGHLEAAERLVRESSGLRSTLFGETLTHARIFKAVVTPTRLTLHGPELEPMNRILRKFSDHSCFIRAQFCDENGQDLFFNPKISLDFVYERFKRVLSNGFEVAGRVYKLLGFSHSSLRAHSAWLSAPFIHQGQLQIPDLIITGLGKFDNLKSPARRAARIGQAFSETPYVVDLDEHMVEVLKISDIKRNGREFSDGVGTISPGAANAIYSVIPRSKGTPTCFQIRWGGAKGMLSMDPRLEGIKICIRPSMVKFESNDRHLEICDMASKPMPMALNRQLIKILEDMGAPGNWFLNLQNREVQRLRGITSTVYNTASFLRSQRIGETIQLHKFLRQAEAMGIDYRRDGFLRGAVEVTLLRELRLLKHKARIPVRKGMTLFGVMDETGFLNEGEVYVTYDDGQGWHSEPPGPGPVIVTRSPALHPGDIQIASNTIPPDGHPLAQLRNCVVFSMWGSRDLPSQLSGGDLDGDVFHIIWDPKVVETLTTFPPADYARVDPLELDRPVTLTDMASFFVDFMKTDHVGVIAIRHTILADQKENGTLDRDCITVAELHSSAVDFSKTGIAVELSQLPRSSPHRPDFLASGPSITIHDRSEIETDEHRKDEDEEDGEGGPRYRHYRSDKILGQLYRAVDEQNIWAQDIRRTVMTGGPSFWDQLLARLKERVSTIAPVEWQHCSEEANRIHHA